MSTSSVSAGISKLTNSPPKSDTVVSSMTFSAGPMALVARPLMVARMSMVTVSDSSSTQSDCAEVGDDGRSLAVPLLKAKHRRAGDVSDD